MLSPAKPQAIFGPIPHRRQRRCNSNVIRAKLLAGRNETFCGQNFASQRAPRERAFRKMKMRARRKDVHRSASLLREKSAPLKDNASLKQKSPAQIRHENKFLG